MKPLISVIVPIYKVEKYLDECIQSIVSQTYTNLEIILVDDGSPDRCPQMCDEWAAKDSRIRVIHQENGGLSAARNAGLDTASGDYIGFVDSDDYIRSDMYETLLDLLMDSKKKIAYCYSLYVLPDGNEVCYRSEQSVRFLNTKQTLNALHAFDFDIGMMSKLYEKELFESLRFPVGEVNEDMTMWIPLLDKSDGICDSGRILYCYRMNPNSITRSNTYVQDKNSHLVYQHLDQMKEQMIEYGLSDCLKGFGVYAAINAYQIALIQEKAYPKLSDKVKKDYAVYRKMLREYAGDFMLSRRVKAKDRVLYILLLLRLIRPVYRLFGK